MEPARAGRDSCHGFQKFVSGSRAVHELLPEVSPLWGEVSARFPVYKCKGPLAGAFLHLEPVGIDPTSEIAFLGGYYAHSPRIDFAFTAALTQTPVALVPERFRRATQKRRRCD